MQIPRFWNASQRLRNEYIQLWKTSIKTADKQWSGPSQVDDNLNFFLIFFHVLCLPFFIYSHSFISPFSGLSPPLLSPPSLPEAHYLGTESLLFFNTLKIITGPATALVSSLVNHLLGQGEKQSAPGSAMKMFILYSSITSSGKSIYTASASQCLDNSADMKEKGNNFWGKDGGEW